MVMLTIFIALFVGTFSGTVAGGLISWRLLRWQPSHASPDPDVIDSDVDHDQPSWKAVGHSSPSTWSCTTGGRQAPADLRPEPAAAAP
jgi:hypothetical protein